MSAKADSQQRSRLAKARRPADAHPRSAGPAGPQGRRVASRDVPRARPRGHTFKTVEAIGRALPDVEVTTAWGHPALKVRGKMFACIASNKSAEPNSLVVMMGFPERDALVEDDPGTYYLKEHYLNYPCVLVRLSRVGIDALRDIVTGAHRLVGASARRKSSTGRRPRPAPPSRVRR